MEKILIVDDEENILVAFKRILKDKGYEVHTATNGEDAINCAKKKDINLILMDINMPGINGMEAFHKIKEKKSKVPIIMMTGFGSTEVTIETMRMGAYDYVTKPFDMEQMLDLIKKAIAQSHMNKTISIEEQNANQNIQVDVQKIIGNSNAMQNLYKLVGKVAASTVPVLIQGESGTGKELIARAVYSYSDRKDKTFMAVNCAAIPETLLESELFGYEKGAFTGANERRIGRFEQCDSGTLFLDEIGDMPIILQAKLLRVLQSGELERLGSNQTIKVDVRIISATNQNMMQAVSQNKFREDLFYRLNVVTLNVPPLRDRKEDIPLLVNYFLKKFEIELSKKASLIKGVLEQQLVPYTWPGNVRELENVMKRATVLSKDGMIREEDIVLRGREDTPHVSNTALDVPVTSEDTLSAVLTNYLGPMFKAVMKCSALEREDILPKIEEALIGLSLEALNHNQVQVSRLLGITRNTLRKRIEQFDMD